MSELGYSSEFTPGLVPRRIPVANPGVGVGSVLVYTVPNSAFGTIAILRFRATTTAVVGNRNYFLDIAPGGNQVTTELRLFDSHFGVNQNNFFSCVRGFQSQSEGGSTDLGWSEVVGSLGNEYDMWPSSTTFTLRSDVFRAGDEISTINLLVLEATALAPTG